MDEAREGLMAALSIEQVSVMRAHDLGADKPFAGIPALPLTPRGFDSPSRFDPDISLTTALNATKIRGASNLSTQARMSRGDRRRRCIMALPSTSRPYYELRH